MAKAKALLQAKVDAWKALHVSTTHTAHSHEASLDPPVPFYQALSYSVSMYVYVALAVEGCGGS
jgi:hypothetical protein